MIDPIKSFRHIEIDSIDLSSIVQNPTNVVKYFLSLYSNFEGYIFCILQHFATKLCNFTNFSMLFLAVVIYLHLLA
jgi:hypothetical protein